MSVVTICGSDVHLDENGFLEDQEEWSREVSEYLANETGIEEMTEDHWKVIEAMRKHYAEYSAHPIPKQVCKKLGLDEKCVSDLLSMGITEAARIAGLPRPTGDV